MKLISLSLFGVSLSLHFDEDTTTSLDAADASTEVDFGFISGGEDRGR